MPRHYRTAKARLEIEMKRAQLALLEAKIPAARAAAREDPATNTDTYTGTDTGSARDNMEAILRERLLTYGVNMGILCPEALAEMEKAHIEAGADGELHGALLDMFDE